MPKTLFISYSHDSEEHKAWVKQFADDLVSKGGFEVLLDQNLPKGFPLTRFMEQGLVNADKVLIIGTPQYKQKSESGKGVAFEGSIISTELMHDIESCKYYPILRSGSFETSFPESLQGRGGDDLSDDDKYEEKLQEVIDSIANEKPIPAALLKKKPIQTEVEEQRVANVYLGQNILYETYWGKPTGQIEGIGIGVTITSTSKENRFFNQPLFKVSTPFEGDADTFSLMNMIIPVRFPVKMEYGERVSVTYKLASGTMNLFEEILKKDANATIKAIVTTSFGEYSISEPYQLAELVKNKRYVK